MKLGIYIAGPLYSSGEYDQNIRLAIQAATWITEMGRQHGHEVYCFVPHACIFPWQMVSPRTHEEGQAWDDYWLSKCDALYRLPGQSVGSDHEVALARELGITVLHDYDVRSYFTLLEARP